MSDNAVFGQIKSEIDDNDVVLFMKGSPMFPQCGFSAAVAHVLTTLQVKFKGVDVLQDMEVREGIKQFSNWPTIPQLYVKGEFVGGCDIVREMAETGELQKLLDDNKIAHA
jgi:monothiol glutaredoxin